MQNVIEPGGGRGGGGGGGGVGRVRLGYISSIDPLPITKHTGIECSDW